MSELKRLANRRRHVLQKIEDAERHIDHMAAGLEDLRRQRDALSAEIKDFVLGLPIAQACHQLAEDVLDAEVIYETR